MTFRDDHDAALARADALARELSKARADAAEKAAQLANAEGEQQRLARELEQARTPHLENKPKGRATTGDEARDWWWIRPRERSVTFYVVVILLIGWIAGRFAWIECNRDAVGPTERSQGR